MFYTYLWLREDGTPYYVGKGKGRRGFESRNHRHKCPPKDRIITQNWRLEAEAFEAEKFLILYYGRLDQGTGCLRNLTDGGENPPNKTGFKHSEKTLKKMSEYRKGKELSVACRGAVISYHRNTPMPVSVKEKISNTLRGRKRPEDVVGKIRLGLLGHRVSEETRKRIGEKNKESWKRRKALSGAQSV